MPTRTADAEWQGNLQQGRGTMRVGSGAFEGSYSFKSRMGDEMVGTNPEELISPSPFLSSHHLVNLVITSDKHHLLRLVEWPLVSNDIAGHVHTLLTMPSNPLSFAY